MHEEDLLQAITIAWDLDDGTGISIRYGDMDPGRAADLLRIAADLVAAHVAFLDELEDEDTIEILSDVDDEWDGEGEL
jgi:hypothetical protein